ncbi:hypothetical protein AVEN_145122-1 [Araneus ventricosus]|uniref:RING-type domain-containing protein n=1 Tax=Araneus ventricosus TaxID=182803 RepID=A0A4Y2JI66_ARAVE|nr:hypothetical protein AVEN_145122-1 [Araneus ventricosus]
MNRKETTSDIEFITKKFQDLMLNSMEFPLEDEPMDLEFTLPLFDFSEVQPAALELMQSEPMDIEYSEPMDIEYNDPKSNEKANGTLADTIQCAICLETDRSLNRKSLPCSHAFHEKCINKWLKRSATCPICRSTIFSRNHAIRLDANWTRETTWLTATYIEYEQTRDDFERNGTNRRREYVHLTHSHSTSNGNGFIRQRRVLVARRRW